MNPSSSSSSRVSFASINKIKENDWVPRGWKALLCTYKLPWCVYRSPPPFFFPLYRTGGGGGQEREMMIRYDEQFIKTGLSAKKKKKSFSFPGRRPLISLSEIFSCDDTTFSFRCGTHAGSVLERIRFFDNWSCVTSRLVSGPRWLEQSFFLFLGLVVAFLLEREIFLLHLFGRRREFVVVVSSLFCNGDIKFPAVMCLDTYH